MSKSAHEGKSEAQCVRDLICENVEDQVGGLKKKKAS